MSFGRRTLSALGKVGIVISVTIVFLFGLMGTVYLSLRTAEVKVPDLTGKDRLTAERTLEDMGLKIRVRGTKPTMDRPDTVLNQVPDPGMTVKEGIQVAVEVSRAPKEGESAAASLGDTQTQNANKPEKPEENSNVNQTPAMNQNQSQSQNQNQNKPKNKNKNSNNANNRNANNSNNANSNRNANSNNMNANRGATNANRNANTIPNANRATTNANANKRAPVTNIPANPGTNKRTP